MTRGDSGAGDEAAIRAALADVDPADAPGHAQLLRSPVPDLRFDADTGPAVAPRRRRFGRRARLATVALVALSAGAGGVAVGWDNWGTREDYREVVRCYTSSDVRRGEDSGDAYVGAFGPKDSPAVVLEMCSDLWHRGHILPGRPAAPGESSNEPGRPVPPLITCVVDGYVSAIPALTGETCMSLKLRAWPVN